MESVARPFTQGRHIIKTTTLTFSSFFKWSSVNQGLGDVSVCKRIYLLLFLIDNEVFEKTYTDVHCTVNVIFIPTVHVF